MSQPKTVTKYTGADVDVAWDKRLCIHVGECGRAAGDLFVGGRDPWCAPDQTTVADVTDVCERCPTGALTYARRDGGAEESPAAANTLTVAHNGPLYLRGDLAIEAADDTLPGVRFRAALCRCGQSAAKPFCDNSHVKANFEDSGAVGEAGGGCPAPGGKLVVKAAPNGPLLLKGNLAIMAATGRVAWHGEKVALCRCGASGNKPFCDGSHKRIGFEAE